MKGICFRKEDIIGTLPWFPFSFEPNLLKSNQAANLPKQETELATKLRSQNVCPYDAILQEKLLRGI